MLIPLEKCKFILEIAIPYAHLETEMNSTGSRSYRPFSLLGGELMGLCLGWREDTVKKPTEHIESKEFLKNLEILTGKIRMKKNCAE